jgi:hypothetical protein
MTTMTVLLLCSLRANYVRHDLSALGRHPLQLGALRDLTHDHRR